ncbi:MAG: hypothetical protein MI784_02910 [Cytophagales bacterium]|nr:hypothetical protein [Cytophagales bacterium]
MDVPFGYKKTLTTDENQAVFAALCLKRRNYPSVSSVGAQLECISGMGERIRRSPVDARGVDLAS